MNEKDYARQLLATMLGRVQVYRHAGVQPVVMYAVTTRYGVEVEINPVFGATEVELSTHSEVVEDLIRSCWGVAQLLAAEGRDYIVEPLTIVYADELRAEADAFFAQPVAA